MAAQEQAAEPAPVWLIAQDQAVKSSVDVSNSLRQAQDLGYDLRTISLTNIAFHERVYHEVSQYISKRRRHVDEDNAVEGPNGVVADQTDGFAEMAPLLLSPLTPADTDLSPDEANSAFIGLVSPWIDLASSDSVIRYVSQQVLKLEIAYAAFCGLQNVMIHGPQSEGDAVSYARSILGAIGIGPYISLNILLPMVGELEKDSEIDKHLTELAEYPHLDDDHHHNHDDLSEDMQSTWSTWDLIRSVCEYSPRLGIALEIPRQMPTVNLRNRWYAEPVRCLVFPRTSFVRNAKGFPVLSKQQQSYLTQMMRLRFPPWIILSGVTEDEESHASGTALEPTPAEANTHQSHDPVPHLRYMRHLQHNQPMRSVIERFGQGYQDFIQSPLQPLADNLESVTYEVFEKDPVKYDQYEQAIRNALESLANRLGSDPIFNIAVVGSGRGPLVSKALLASQAVDNRIRYWAIEKNPNAYVHLQRRNATDPLWLKNEVTVVKTDMRHWRGPIVDGVLQKVDILVSELLGSFGDNELSPECLDGVQHVLRPETGISIPQSYTSHMTPISSPRLHSDLLSRPGTEKWEIPAVVMLQQQDFLSQQAGDDGMPDVRQAWAFSHPLPEDVLSKANLRAGGNAESGGPGGIAGGDGSNEHNSRYAKASFACKHRGVCHGIAGYFEAVLFADASDIVELSINPITIAEKSKDMISWFPIFFPLKVCCQWAHDSWRFPFTDQSLEQTPLHVPDNGNMQVSMWRMTDDRKVWYEWLVEVFDGTRANKRIAMSQLHSSKQNGCLL